MVNVKIDEDTLVEMLMDRLDSWNPTDEAETLYQDYYENLVYEHVFDGREFDVYKIVDNDWVNNLSVVGEDEMDEYDIEDWENDERVLGSTENYKGEKFYLIYNN